MTTREFQWFWDRVDQSGGPNSCWPWKGEIKESGYGRVYIKSMGTGAHRLALILKCGEPPTDKPCACHSCDNRSCCNPAHLRWGSYSDNEQDKIARGRDVSPNRKFDEAALIHLRGQGWSYSMLASHFGVNQSSIARALKRRGLSGSLAVNGVEMAKLRAAREAGHGATARGEG